ncbi:MAG TPA: hypothetical protein EYM84_04500 [Flavobacteriales bacterium]|nr:hypothetical protein [Flavobacteriales bacterium]HIN39514.1 hypothetical protein [Flavobacteriales bacterium]
MVYFIVKHICKLAIKTFYGKISFRNRKKIPKDVPLLLLANHTNAFMDSLVLAVFMARKMKSLPKGIVFLGASKIKIWFFSQIGMIPIFRAIEGNEHLHRNEETFQNCFQVLKKKGCVQVFPEAICIPERRMKSAKKGTARIALGAEEAHEYALNTQVLFVGMNYEKAWSFKSKLFLNYSRPYDISSFCKLHQENKVSGLNALTKFIDIKIRPHVIHIDDKEDDDIVGQVEQIYKPQLFKDYRLKSENASHNFLLSREIANGINYLRMERPEQLLELRNKCIAYFDKLNVNKIEDTYIFKRPNISYLLGKFLFLSLGFPLHIYGLVNNYIPAKISKTIADKVVKKTDFYSSVTMLAGICSFMVFYLLNFSIVVFFSESLAVSLIYGATLILSGNFSTAYLSKLKAFKSMLRYWKFDKGEHVELKELIHERSSLVEMLNNLKQVYRLRHQKNITKNI